MLEWSSDHNVKLDDTLIFSKGYDYFGLENLSQGAIGINGNYLIWPNRNHKGENWTLYRDSDGAIAFEKFETEYECKLEAEYWCADKII